MAVDGRSGQWEEGSGIRDDVGQWRWEEGRRIWRLMYCFCLFFVCQWQVCYVRFAGNGW